MIKYKNSFQFLKLTTLCGLFGLITPVLFDSKDMFFFYWGITIIILSHFFSMLIIHKLTNNE